MLHFVPSVFLMLKLLNICLSNVIMFGKFGLLGLMLGPFRGLPPGNMRDFLISWNTFFSECEHNPVWRMAFMAILWTTWIHRNNLVFNGKIWDSNLFFYVVKLRVGWWAKANWPLSNSSILEMVKDLIFIKAFPSNKKTKKSCDWNKPPFD
ncbi:Uncharacterized protein TCM_014089, partial [Theobroma cacao]